MNIYIVRQINEFTNWKTIRDEKDEYTSEHERTDGKVVMLIQGYEDRLVDMTKREHVAHEMVVTSQAKAKSVATCFLDNIRSDVHHRFYEDVQMNAGNPYEVYFEDQKDVPRLCTIYKRLRENIGKWDCEILDRFGFPSYRDTENKYIERSLSKYSIDRLLEDNPHFIPDEELTQEMLDKYYEFSKFESKKGKPRKVKKHSDFDRQRYHTPKIDMVFDYGLNEDVLLGMKAELDTAWDNYMDSIQLRDKKLEGKEGRVCKYQLTNKYFIESAPHMHRQFDDDSVNKPNWNDSGRAHYTWIEILVVTPTKHSDVHSYEYDMWLKDKKAQAEAREMREREEEMRLYAAESGHNNMVMNADGSFETWREF